MRYIIGTPSKNWAFYGKISAQHSVHPTGGSLRVFRQFVWLEVDSVKTALSRPTHQRVTQTVGRTNSKSLLVFCSGLG